jgi:hypothetical protein
MNFAQSPHIPSEGKKPRWRDLPWLSVYAIRGLGELVRARLLFARLRAKDIPVRNRTARGTGRAGPVQDTALLARISYVLPRISDRLPWRSDCLVQAIAGQSWLSASGTASEIQIGVEKPDGGEFGAHAWLICDGIVITGGDIDRYHLLLSDSRLDRNTGHEPGSSGHKTSL